MTEYMTPSRALKRILMQIASDLIGADRVIDHAPYSDIEFPFIWLDRTIQTNQLNTDELGTVNSIVRIYGRREQSREVDKWARKLEMIVQQPFDAYGYHFSLRAFNINEIIENDNGRILTHYNIETQFNYNKLRSGIDGTSNKRT